MAFVGFVSYNINYGGCDAPVAEASGKALKERRGVAATPIDGIVGFVNYNINHER